MIQIWNSSKIETTVTHFRDIDSFLDIITLQIYKITSISCNSANIQDRDRKIESHILLNFFNNVTEYFLGIDQSRLHHKYDHVIV